MDRVEEIEVEIDRLPPAEFEQLARWFRARDNASWDQQLDADCQSGKLDFLFDAARDESTHTLLRDWPSDT